MGLIQIGKKHEKGRRYRCHHAVFGRKAANWARKGSLWPMTFRVGVLRDRDDCRGFFTV